MWIFLISCYGLMGLSTLLLLLTGYVGYSHEPFLGINHPRIGTVTIIVLSLTETLVMYYFIATSKAYKPLIASNAKFPEFHKRMIQIKMPIYKHVSLTVLLFGMIFILGGAVDNHFSIGWLHGQLFLVSIIYYFYALKIKNSAFKAQVDLINEMDKIL